MQDYQYEHNHSALGAPEAHSAGEQEWVAYRRRVDQSQERFQGLFLRQSFIYQHPEHLQPLVPDRLRKAYAVKVNYLEWGQADQPILVCCGGIANVAERFNDLALELMCNYRVVCMDWVGRGGSGWLADQGDYSLATYVEQLRQLLSHLGGQPVALLGSSLGASAAIELVAAHPASVTRLILNDTGPYIPNGRRYTRAQTLARHYVFRSPDEMLRKIGASQKNDGPVRDAVRLLIGYAQTKWSDSDAGRIYRHDVRAMQAYQLTARRSVRQWPQWESIACPVLLIRGMQTDMLSQATTRYMLQKPQVTLMHIPHTGHTPALVDPNHIGCIQQWLSDSQSLGRELCSPYREDACDVV
jgi:pimeloyl-ACP methyl ester carboxylesterase